MTPLPKGDLGVSLRPGTLDDMDLLQGMYSKLLSVLAQSNPTVDPTHCLQTDWVENPGKLATWLVERSDAARPEVGFALVCGKTYAEALGSPTDYLLYEYFIEESERRRGIGKAALELLLRQHPGTWSLDVLPGNLPAMAFWSAALAVHGPEATERVDEEGVTFIRYVFHVRKATP